MGAFRMRQQPQQPDFDLLPPTQRRRVPQWSAPGLAGDVCDAQFVVIDQLGRSFGDARSNDNRVPPVHREKQARLRHEQRITAAAMRAEKFLERFSERSFAVMVALVFGAVFMLASGFAGMQVQGMTVPAAALDITHASLIPQDNNGMRVLLINGIIENRGTAQQSVPQIRADLLHNGRLVASTLIEAPVAALEHGHSRGFSAKLQHPGGKLPELRLSFVERDVMAR